MNPYPLLLPYYPLIPLLNENFPSLMWIIYKRGHEKLPPWYCIWSEKNKKHWKSAKLPTIERDERTIDTSRVSHAACRLFVRFRVLFTVQRQWAHVWGRRDYRIYRKIVFIMENVERMNMHSQSMCLRAL